MTKTSQNTALNKLFNRLKDIEVTGYPPIDRWQPDYIDSIDMVIQRDGTWLHEGDPILRPKLVNLFASVLWKENGHFFLKTPVEQLKITVEDAPFIMTQLDIVDAGQETQQLVFTSSYGDVIVADGQHPITVQHHPDSGEPAPYITVRYNMPGKLSRSVFYQLAEQATLKDEQLWVQSRGMAFSLGSVLE